MARFERKKGNHEKEENYMDFTHNIYEARLHSIILELRFHPCPLAYKILACLKMPPKRGLLISLAVFLLFLDLLDLTSILMKDRNAEGGATRSPLEAVAEETTKSHAKEIPQKKRKIGRIMQAVMMTTPITVRGGAGKNTKVA
jgi:hypothetical protein